MYMGHRMTSLLSPELQGSQRDESHPMEGLTGVAFVSCLPYVVLLLFEAGSYYAALAGTSI